MIIYKRERIAEIEGIFEGDGNQNENECFCNRVQEKFQVIKIQDK